jgi:chromosomal replication initiator protein
MIETWQNALEILRNRLDREQFDTWLSPIRPAAGADGTLTLEVPDEFFARWVTDNYLELIKDALWDCARRHVGIDFKVRGAADAEPDDAGLAIDNPATAPGREAGLVPWYTFETFVVAPSNEVAHSACELVASNPAGAYNPLFIYGGVGLGKTHLLHAIGHALRARSPGTRVLYMSAESYVNEVMTAVKNGRLDVLRYRYRGQCDVLLVDDVQYLANREFAQEEFFHTFNELYNAQKQIVISADQFPTSIPKVSERLRSRFEWGLIVDIGPPEPDLRVKILKRKAAREGYDLPDEVAAFLADRFHNSVREIEGALNRVTAHALIRKIPITLDLARRVTERILTDRRGRLTADTVLKTVADYFQLQVADIKSERRNRSVSKPRQIAILLLRRHTGASLPAIGASIGGRSHTTILASLEQVEKLMASEPAVERAIKDIERQLGL